MGVAPQAWLAVLVRDVVCFYRSELGGGLDCRTRAAADYDVVVEQEIYSCCQTPPRMRVNCQSR